MGYLEDHMPIMDDPVVLPSQWGPPTAVAHPEARLWLAVLEMGIRDASMQLGPSTKRAAWRHVASARAWVRSEDEEWSFSFVRLCYGLGVNPEWLRARLERGWRPLPPPRPMRRSGMRGRGEVAAAWAG